MPGHHDVIIYEDEEEKGNKLVADADFIFTLDFNTLKRIDALGERVAESKAKKIIIMAGNNFINHIDSFIR